MNDLRFALRQLLKNPGFTAVAVLTLALGIGANTAMFTIFNSLLLRPVPVKDPGSVVRLHTTDTNRAFFGHLSYPDYRDIRDQNASLAGLAAASAGEDFFLESSSQEVGSLSGLAEKARGVLVSGNYFSVLGGAFAAGRGFIPAEDLSPGTHPVAVLSHGFWKRRFGGDPAVVGKTIRLNSSAFTVVGVAAAEFRAMRFDRMPDVWVPLAMQAELMPGEDRLSARDHYWLQVDGRLKPGASMTEAEAEIKIIAGRLAEAHQGGKLVPLTLMSGSFLDPEDRQKLAPLAGGAMTAVGLIMLIAGANLSSLLLSRAASRRREFAVRLSLGAGRGRLLRQLFTENALLGALGTGLGLLVALWMADFVVVLVAGTEARSALGLPLDWRVLAYALLIAGLTVFGFGLAPALQTAKQDVSSVLKDEAGGITRSVTRSRLRSVLVGGQVALSLMLLVSSGLLIRTLQRGLTLDTGMDIGRTVAVSLDLARHRYDEPRASELSRLLAERLGSLPNVRGIARASAVPLSGVRNATDFHIEDRGADSGNPGVVLAVNDVSANFFKVLGVPIFQGRMFTEHEVQTRQPVALVTEASAQRLWPGGNALGKRIRRGSTGPAMEVIGMVRNSPNQALYEDEPDIFLPLRPDQQRDLSLLVRTTDGSKALLETIFRETQALDAALWPEVALLADNTRRRLRGETTLSWLASGLGLVALILAVTGLYGMLSWLVSQRTRELGIRMALGAERGNVIHLVLRQGMWLVTAGIAVGMLGTVAASRVLQGMIYDLSPLDPLALAGATGLLLIAALLACWFPARRAARVNPIVALRTE